MLQSATPTLVKPLPATATVVRAATPALRDAAFKLRYRAYRATDSIPENGSQRFRDPYDYKPNAMTYLLMDGDEPNAMTYLLMDGDEPIGAIRASVYIPERGIGLPSFESYRDEIALRIGFDRRIVEPSRFVTAETSFDVMLDTQFRLFRMIAANAVVHEADWVITAMRRKHVAIYRRLFGMQPLSDPKPYPGVRDLGVLCGLPFRDFAAMCAAEPRLAIDRDEAGRYAA